MTNPELEGIENDIIDSLRSPDWMPLKNHYRKVYIESGAANDEITDFELVTIETVNKKERHVRFKTTHTIFPAYISLKDYENVEVETDGYGHPLFVHVW